MEAPRTPRPGPPPSPGRLTLPATPFLSRLGYGTGVSVYLYQRSPALGRLRSPWAVKKVNRRHAQSQFGRRLEEEAAVLRSLAHPNIIQFKGFQPAADGVHALLMEHGHQSLFDRIEARAEEDGGAFPAAMVGRTVGWVAGALHYLHTDRHIMHGDIKSGNVLVVGNFETAKLCDFGVTLPLDREGKVTGGAAYVGTEAWSAREVIREEEVITSKADIFAFGLVIFEMLSLHSPHIDKLCVEEGEGSEAEEEQEAAEEEFRAALGSRPRLPDSVDLDESYRKVLEIFFATTATEPAGRPSAAEVLELLEAEEADDSILCVNMLPGQAKEAAEDEMDDSVVCVTLEGDALAGTTTPASAV